MSTRPIEGPRRAVVFTPMEDRRRVLVEAAVLADRLGYEAVVVPEGWGFDATVVLAEIAVRTERVRLVAGVLSIWGRSPATMAMAAATLDDLSGGRFTLGVGTSTAALAEQFHDVPFTGMAERLGHVVQQVRTLLRGDRAQPARGGRGLRLGQPPRPTLPVWVAGLGPKAAGVARDHGDGWFPALVPRDRLGELRRAVLGDAPVVVACGPMASVADTPAEARAAAGRLIGWYLTGMGRAYGDFVAANGFAAEVAALRAANPRPSPVSIVWPAEADVLLDQLAATGRPDEVAQQLRSWDEVADIVTVGIGPGPAEVVLATVEAAAPRRR